MRAISGVFAAEAVWSSAKGATSAKRPTRHSFLRMAAGITPSSYRYGFGTELALFE